MVPDLGSRRAGGLRASILEKRPDAVKDELAIALGELGITEDHPEMQSSLPKMECYTYLGAVNTHLYTAMIDGYGNKARFKPSRTEDLKLDPDFRAVMLPMFQDSFRELAEENYWVQVTRTLYPRAHNVYINPPTLTEMDAHSPARTMDQEVNGGDLGPTVQQLVALARKLEVQNGQRLQEGASDGEIEKLLQQRRAVVENYLIPLGLARSTINIGYHVKQAANLQPLSHLEGSIRQLTTRQGHSHTSFRRSSADNMREVYPNDPSMHEGPTLKCPFRHGKLAESDDSPMLGYLHAGIDLAYDKGYFRRINDDRALRGDPDLTEVHT